jgi:methionyl-tRNA formyltransferase
MRIVLIGQAAFGEKVLEGLLERGEQVVGVFSPPDPPGKPSGLKLLADRHSLPLHQPSRMRQPEVFDVYAALKPDLAVMAFVTDILPERFLTKPNLGAIQYHPSLLPRHRGGSAIQWAVIQGDTETGLSIFWPDAGIDTGPILLQKRVVIDPDDTTGSLYFNKLFPLGVEALVDAVRMVREGTAPRLEQDHTQATYEPLCTEEHATIDWTLPARQVYNLIRGCNPQPGARTDLRGQPIKIFDSRLKLTGTSAEPGEVLDAAPDSITVACGEAAIRILRLQPGGAAKIGAGQFAIETRLAPGERLGQTKGAPIPG